MIKLFTIFIVAFCTTLCVASQLIIWECNYCHQQYIGENPPRFIKCPAKDNKQTHWWIRKK